MAICHRHRSRLLGDSLTARRRARAATGTTTSGAAKQFDEAYFDKWYRHPAHRVKSPAELARQVAFVLHTAEWVLGRPVRSVLDVGCGEGQWRAALRAHRPRLRYTGVDPSAWAVARHGRRRGLLLGDITALDTLPLDASYDLVVCCGMLNYLAAEVLVDGVRQVARRTGGVAYLELFTNADDTEGDTSWPAPRAASWYRGVLQRAGLVSIGMQCWIPAAAADRVAAMERA